MTNCTENLAIFSSAPNFFFNALHALHHDLWKISIIGLFTLPALDNASRHLNHSISSPHPLAKGLGFDFEYQIIQGEEVSVQFFNPNARQIQHDINERSRRFVDAKPGAYQFCFSNRHTNKKVGLYSYAAYHMLHMLSSSILT